MTATPSEYAWQDAERQAARWVRAQYPAIWKVFLRRARQHRGLTPEATTGRPPKTERQPI